MDNKNAIKRLSGAEKALVAVSKVLMSAGGAVDFQREYPLPFTGGKRMLLCGWKGMLTSIEFLQSKGMAVDQWDEKFIVTEPCPGPFGLSSELCDIHTDDPYSVTPITKTIEELEMPAEPLKPEAPVDPFVGMSEGDLEQYVFDSLLNKPASEEHATKFLQVAQALCKVCKDKYWNHTVCHFIEGYGHDVDGKMPSLLNYIEKSDFPQYKEALDVLVARAFPEPNCLDRIVLPIVEFNLNAWIKDPSAPTFAHVSPAMREPSNIEAAKEVFKKEDWRDPRRALLLMQCSGPAELWKSAKASGIPIFGDDRLSDYGKAPFSKSDLSVYLADVIPNIATLAGGFTAAEVANNLTTRISGDTVPGVFVDVDGTLLHSNSLVPYSKDIESNLLEAMGRGIPVTVFSGGDPKVQSARLLASGADPRLAEVRSKRDYVGKRLEVLIDDTPAAVGGFGAERYMSPCFASQPGALGFVELHIDQEAGMDM